MRHLPFHALAGVVAITAACRAVPPPSDPPATHPGSALAVESAMPVLRGSASDAVAAPTAAPADAMKSSMGGGGR